MEIPMHLKEKYVQRRRDDVVQCRNALRNDDYKTIEMVGHQLKGNGVSFGFQILSDIGKSLEQAAKEKSSDEVSTLLNQFDEAVKKITLH